MRGASEEDSHRVLGGSFHIRKAFAYALFLGLQNVGNFETAVEDEAIVDAPWVRLCISHRPVATGHGTMFYIYLLRGVIPPLLIPLQWYFPTTLKAE